MRRRPLLCVLFLGAFPHPASSAAWVTSALLEWFKNSDVVSDLHAKHVASDRVQHMFKGTPFASMPDAAKISFAKGPAGRAVADFMAAEQEILGNWKVRKIVEAAGGSEFDPVDARSTLLEEVGKAPVTVFSFVDCPWCLLAKELLSVEPYRLSNGDGTLRVVELEDLGRRGKELRAAIGLATGRTSMPACFVGGTSVGGYTDGFPIPSPLDESRSKMTKTPAVKKMLWENIEPRPSKASSLASGGERERKGRDEIKGSSNTGFGARLG